MQRLVIRNGWKEQEGLEKPADMGEMPLGGADIWHRLNDIIFGYQRLTQLLREAANFLILLYKIISGSRLSDDWTVVQLCHFTSSLMTLYPWVAFFRHSS